VYWRYVPVNTVRPYKTFLEMKQCFRGIPSEAVFPGVMIIEALAQTAGIVIDSGKGDAEFTAVLFSFAGINNANFRVPLFPAIN
jgi:3-hydroxymyristoyl/3-hydroxydecanoyl-(acyl carrier protein) dehydratase